MAIQSKEFVGIAEGIKSHELSTKGKIESLRGAISELSGQRMSLGNRISYLEAALAAAYEDTDEDGDPDYGRISAIEAQINVAERELSAVEGQLDAAHGELSHSEAELESVMEEKAQTLFEIQERARKTSSNIAVAGGMYGAYSGVGSSLQSSMQTSLASLSQAASILDGSVDGFAGGGAGGASGGSSGASHGSISTSALNAFTAPANVDTAHSHSSGNFSTSQTSTVTPAAISGFHSSQQSGSTQKTSNYHSSQRGSAYATAAFSGENDGEAIASAANYQSNQTSSNAVAHFLSDNKESSESGSSQTQSNTKAHQPSENKVPASASNMFSDLHQLTMSAEEVIQYDLEHRSVGNFSPKPADGIEKVRELGEDDLRWEDATSVVSNNTVSFENDSLCEFSFNSTKVSPPNFENSPLKRQLILEESEKWKSSLTADEEQAVRDYTFTYHKNINAKLRGKVLFFDKGNKERSERIHNALQKSKTPCYCTVYRGASIEALGKYQNLPDEELVGKVLLDKGFMSTSIDPESAFGGSVKFEILVPEGKHAAYVSNGTSAVGDSEKELLFDKGQRLKIVGIKYDHFGNRTIQARMM